MELPSGLHATVVYLMLVWAVGMMQGRFFRVCALAFGMSMAYVLAADQFAFHHGWVLVAMGSLWCVGLSRPESFGVLHWSETSTVALKILFTVSYLFAGLNKLSGEFWNGAVVREILRPGLEAFGDIRGFAVLAAIGACALELFIPVALWFRKVRWMAMSAGLALHAGIILLAGRGLLLNLPYLAGYLLFLEPGRRDAVIRYTQGTKMRLLRRLDLLDAIEWQADQGVRVRFEVGGRVVVGRLERTFWTLRLILGVNPVTITFVGLSAVIILHFANA